MTSPKIAIASLITLVLTGQILHADGQIRIDNQVGEVSRLTNTKGDTIDNTTLATLQGAFGRGFVSQKDPIHFRDILNLQQNHLFVDLQFDVFNESRAILGGRRKLKEISMHTEGSYEIRSDTTLPLNPVQLVVRQGTMVVEHVSGSLQVLAAGIRTRIWGTTVLFHVNPDDSTGYAFLREGTIEFIDFGMRESGNNRLWRLIPGSPPVEIALNGPEKRKWKKETKYHTRTVWKGSRPFFKRPGSYIGIGVGVAVLGIVANEVITKDPRSHTGSVSIDIPN